MKQSFFFYDLETSGLNSRADRVMQFAGIRTDQNLKPLGEPFNLLVALSDDTLPNPGALMVTGISPQKTVEEGYSEAEFAKILHEEVFTEDTIVMGFNSIRFDDEFIRALLWRNYHDPYEWAYKDGRSRWDLLDVVRLTRALRPEGIEWPVLEDGTPVNKLELLAKANNIGHAKAHDALSDVEALIGMAKLIHDKQPKLFDYLLKLRNKNEVKNIVNLDTPQPFVYASGRYDSQFNKTTVAYPIAPAEFGNVFVYDLRYDPSDWVAMSAADIAKHLAVPYKERSEDYQKLPVKKLQYNKAPAISPLGVLEAEDGWKKLELSQEIIQKHRNILLQNPEFAKTCADILSKKPDYPSLPSAEAKPYDGFTGDRDKLRSETIRNLSPPELGKYKPDFNDSRLAEMFIRYKARSFPKQLSDEEKITYEDWRQSKLQSEAPGFVKELEKQAARQDLSDHQVYILEELKLWFELIMPDTEQY